MLTSTACKTTCVEDACLSADISVEELSQCIKRLKSGKSPGIDGILADMIKDGGDIVQQCLLWLLNCMLASHFPERLSVGLITAIYKSGDKFDVGKYRGNTVDSVVAKLKSRKLRAGLRSMLSKPRGTQASGKTCCFVDFRKAFDTVPRAVLWQVLKKLGVHGRILVIIESLYAHDSAVITRHFCHLQMSHGCEARMSSESNSIWLVC